VPKITGTFVLTRVELTPKTTKNSNGRPISNFWGSAKLIWDAPRWSALDNAEVDQENSCTCNFDSLWRDKADDFYGVIMRIAREQGFPDGKGATIVMSCGLKPGKPWPSKEAGSSKAKLDETGAPVMNSAIVLVDCVIDEVASLALAQAAEEPEEINFEVMAEPVVAATRHVESDDVFAAIDW
jgi:hypothetical protein